VLDLEFLPSDPGRLVPVYLGHADLAITETDASNALAFSPTPRPYMRRSRAISRIADPAAIVSVSEMRPGISNPIARPLFRYG